jgi:hypothetical protein
MDIRTFDHASGGITGFKAFGHPMATGSARRLVDEIAKFGRVAVVDATPGPGTPGLLDEFASLYDLAAWQVVDSFVLSVDDIGRSVLGRPARPLAELAQTSADVVFVADFEPGGFAAFRHLVPDGQRVVDLTALRLPDAMLARPGEYLHPLNFATNFALFRDGSGLHTRLATVNYWHRYGARDVALWLCLFDEHGQRLAEWAQPLPDAAESIVIDSAEVRRRFGLPPFAGSLFLHALRAEGHEVVKYTLDFYGDGAPAVLTSTHDANAWPAERYAGLPAPREGERVTLWVQNSHPTPIRPGAFALGEMGGGEPVAFPEEIPAFGTRAVDVSALLPGLRWPSQVEVFANRHFVRPRYEVVASNGSRRVAHANVERTDLRANPEIRRNRDRLGRGFLLPAPLLPSEHWRTWVLPTPMATCQQQLCLELYVLDANGREILRRPIGSLPRRHRTAIDVVAWLDEAGANLDTGYGHIELGYDLGEDSQGPEVDGWMHALFRYERRDGAHGADTSFGAHLFNVPLRFAGEPQSYHGSPPGLSTRLFLRLDCADRDTGCLLIYPSSGEWHPHSSTRLRLHNGSGALVSERRVQIPLRGSFAWSYRNTFDAAQRRAAGSAGHVIVRDETCRLFGYQGLVADDGSFSLDHMFGF